MGCHSVIERPECVSRVTPPTTINANTSAQQTRSQVATIRGCSPVAAAEEVDIAEEVAKPSGIEEIIREYYYPNAAPDRAQ
jgi:hypothetical protein